MPDQSTLKRLYETEKSARVAAEREANSAALQRTKQEVIKEHGLSVEAANLLNGSTPEQLKLQALSIRRVIDAEVAKLQPSPEPVAPELSPDQIALLRKRANTQLYPDRF